MSTNEILPDITRSNHGGNEQSEKANRDTEPRKKSARKRIFDEFVRKGASGDIAEAVYTRLGISHQTGSARISELRRDKELVELKDQDGNVVERKTSTGSAAAVLVAAAPKEAHPCR